MKKSTYSTLRKTKMSITRRIYNKIVYYNPNLRIPIDINEYIFESSNTKYCAFLMLKR